MLAVCHHVGRARRIGLFDKPFQRDGLAARAWPAQLQIAIAGFRAVRRNAKRHQFARTRRSRAMLDSLQKGGLIFDQVIGRGHQHQRLRRVLQQQRRRQDRRPGVTRLRFKNNPRIGQTDFGCLIAHQKAKILMGQHQRLGKHLAAEPAKCLLEQALRAQQRRKLLGKRLA